MDLDIVSIIEKKKFGHELSKEEIAFFANGAANGSIKDYQLSALLMAIRLMGMNRRETVDLTLSMAESGDQVDLSAIPGVPTDKHSTGGVGDTTTLVLAPLVAACGVPVAKMSGRGLGHTGGTLDKLESIQGFRVGLTMEEFIAQVQRIGLAVIGQSQNLAPADKALYALRDVTSTVDSLPLIASSIMSKKLASGAKAIVLDVKTGSGAIMHTLENSIELAQAMVRIGTDAGRRMVALVTDMGEPLGSHVGNALEVKEAIDVLSCRVTGPLLEVSLALGAQMLIAAYAAATVEEAEGKLLNALRTGQGLEKLRDMLIAQGGDPRVCDDVSRLPQARVIREVPALGEGFIQSMETTRLGNLAQHIGAGRREKTDVIDYSVGFVLHHRIGDYVGVGEPIATAYCRNEDDADLAELSIQNAIPILRHRVPPLKLVHAIVEEDQITRC
ncbi:MAG TPA: thymidine phosphorylase [Candidatus Limiplasma sp.]|nr:thymidine phosphorylase [Candidatus Limiplasma sp.]HPS81304.1 thymidine phosphorylase [Candidatus Limiplasma sp.]